MDNARRLQYLEAMGIDVWIPKIVMQPAQSSLLAIESNSIENPVQCVEPDFQDAENWDALQTEVATCIKCSLCETRNRTVFGSGNKNADWMLIGEAPGQNEDLQGKPFVGSAGLLLTEMVRAIGLAREEIFITNIVKCRPPGNRNPKPDEIESCGDYLQRQRMLIKPKIILAVGRVAAQTLLKTDEPLAKLRGKVHSLENTPVVVVYHPAYLLRSLLDKRKAWMDLQLAVHTYKNVEG
ncbi:MAG: uracil-DNA glycosylase [Methylobacter sp.]|nr:uracil-DNA glycosylase [Methylobacter sp.]